MEPLEKYRENLFAVRCMNAVSVMSNNRKLSDGVLYSSLQHSLYKSIVTSIAWELEIPLTCCFALDTLKDFPFRRGEGFKDNLRATLKGLRNIPIEEAIAKLEDVQAFALIDNDVIRDVIAASISNRDSFATIDVYEHVGGVMADLLDRLPKDGNGLDWKELVIKADAADSASQEIFEPLEEPIRKLIIESWENHARYLADAMTAFDFKKNCVQINDFLAFENVPESVAGAYLDSFSKFGKLAKKLAKEMDEINELESDRYKVLQKSLATFADRALQGSPESILCICDQSAYGFLNTLLPPI